MSSKCSFGLNKRKSISLLKRYMSISVLLALDSIRFLSNVSRLSVWLSPTFSRILMLTFTFTLAFTFTLTFY